MKPTAQCSYLTPQSEAQVTRQVVESLPSGLERMDVGSIRSRTRYLRYSATSLLALFLAASSFAQAPKLLYYNTEAPTSMPVSQAVVAATGSGTPSPYIVVAALNATAAGEPLQLQLWNATGTTGGNLTHVVTETWSPAPGGCLSYALATLDSSKILAACIDSASYLHLSVWRVVGASPSDFYEMGEQSVASSGFASGCSCVSVTALSPTEVVTATTDPSQDLRVQTWGIAVSGASATVTQQHTAIGGAIWSPYVLALSGTQFVTATDSYTTPLSYRKVIAWSTDIYGNITRHHDLQVATGDTTVIQGIALAPLGGLLGNYEVMTIAQVNPGGLFADHTTYVTSWDISSAGVVTGGNSGSGTEQNAYSSSVGIAWTPSLYPFTVSLTTSDSSLTGGRAEQWTYTSGTWSVLHGTNVGGNHPNPPYGVAVANAGSDSTLIYYVVTYTDESGDVNIQMWSAPA